MYLQIKQATYDFAFLCEYTYDGSYLLLSESFSDISENSSPEKATKEIKTVAKKQIFSRFISGCLVEFCVVAIRRYLSLRSSNVKYKLFQLGRWVMNTRVRSNEQFSTKLKPVMGESVFARVLLKPGKLIKCNEFHERNSHVLSFMDRVFSKFFRIKKNLKEIVFECSFCIRILKSDLF